MARWYRAETPQEGETMKQTIVITDYKKAAAFIAKHSDIITGSATMNGYTIIEHNTRGKLWTVDGSYYTESIPQILNTIDYKQGKREYTIRDGCGEILALAQLY